MEMKDRAILGSAPSLKKDIPTKRGPHNSLMVEAYMVRCLR
jgi:hypothetical protein